MRRLLALSMALVLAPAAVGEDLLEVFDRALLNDPQIVARGVFFERQVGGDSVRYYRTPVTPKTLEPTPAPAQGEHTDAIFLEAGLTEAEIAELKAEGTLRSS